MARAVTIHSWWERPELSLFTLGGVAHFLSTHSLLKLSSLSDGCDTRSPCSSPVEASSLSDGCDTRSPCSSPAEASFTLWRVWHEKSLFITCWSFLHSLMGVTREIPVNPLRLSLLYSLTIVARAVSVHPLLKAASFFDESGPRIPCSSRAETSLTLWRQWLELSLFTSRWSFWWEWPELSLFTSLIF